jgi:DNA-binding transcriptional regulator GbsR (MarR family)
MSYTELADSTAMLKTALRLLKTDADDDIETFKKELAQQIKENETEMDAYDNWLDQKEMEAKYNVDRDY